MFSTHTEIALKPKKSRASSKVPEGLVTCVYYRNDCVPDGCVYRDNYRDHYYTSLQTKL